MKKILLIPVVVVLITILWMPSSKVEACTCCSNYGYDLIGVPYLSDWYSNGYYTHSNYQIIEYICRKCEEHHTVFSETPSITESHTWGIWQDRGHSGTTHSVIKYCTKCWDYQTMTYPCPGYPHIFPE